MKRATPTAMTMQSPGPFDPRLAKVLDHATRAEPCPAAEVLAAYVDRDLDPDSFAACEAHVSTCTRCQAIVATVSLDDDVVTPAGTDIIREHAPAADATVVPFTRSRVLRVAAPIGLAASVLLAVWIARTPPPTPPAAGVALENRALPAAPPTAAGSNVVPSRDGETAPPTKAPVPSSQEARRERRLQTPPPSLPSRSTEAPGSLAASPAAPETTAGARPKAARAASTADEEVRASESAPMAFSPAALLVVSPDGQGGWVVQNGIISRAGPPAAGTGTDTGDDLRAGGAWSDTIAWIVGARGAVWRTTDGAAWSRVPFPTTATLIAVDVTGRDTATVTTEGGERLTTTDGGRTWK